MWFAKTLRDGSTCYVSRRTGIRWIIAVNLYGSIVLYLNGCPVFHSRTRAGAITHMERGDELFA